MASLINELVHMYVPISVSDDDPRFRTGVDGPKWKNSADRENIPFPEAESNRLENQLRKRFFMRQRITKSHFGSYFKGKRGKRQARQMAKLVRLHQQDRLINRRRERRSKDGSFEVRNKSGKYVEKVDATVRNKYEKHWEPRLQNEWRSHSIVN